MATRTREEIERLYEAASELCEMLDTYCEERHKTDPAFPFKPLIEDIDLSTIHLTWETNPNGGPEKHMAKIRVADLLDTNFERVVEIRKKSPWAVT